MPAGAELAFQRLAAVGALPRRRGHGHAAEVGDNALRAIEIALVQQPQLGRAFRERDFPGKTAEQLVPDVAADAVGLEQILQVVNFEQLERAVEQSHGYL